MNIPQILEQQQSFFRSHKTKDIRYRRAALVRFRESVQKHETAIIAALQKDFGKSEFESVMTETGLVLRELDMAINDIWKWKRPQKVNPSLLNFPSRDSIHYEPYGTVLIIAPWNYPFQLALSPLIGAIAAGNTAVVKPSELTPATAAILAVIIDEVFPSDYVTTVQGGIPETTELLAQRWDYIFFTGSVPVGKIIAKAAAQHLTPITLELGGKNPCVIDSTARIGLAAKRIVWGKFLNGGQTCIAPDYLLVHEAVKEELIKALGKEIEKAYGTDPELSKDYPRIINDKNFKRLSAMLNGEQVLYGGKVNSETRYLSPTLLDNPALDSAVMKDEIFGPILPILTYSRSVEIEAVIGRYEKPLSAYVFSSKKSFQRWFLERFSFGGGAINDTVSHFVNDRLPFGGVGSSGIGSYHGEHSFYTFSHSKAIVKKANWLDLWLRYAPYKGKLGLLKKALQWL